MSIIPDRPFHNFGASKIHRTTFLNYKNFAHVLIFRLKN